MDLGFNFYVVKIDGINSTTIFSNGSTLSKVQYSWNIAFISSCPTSGECPQDGHKSATFSVQTGIMQTQLSEPQPFDRNIIFFSLLTGLFFVSAIFAFWNYRLKSARHGERTTLINPE